VTEEGQSRKLAIWYIEHELGLQCGTREKLTPLATSLKIARMTKITMMTVTDVVAVRPSIIN
jgi:hypothetical protein